MSDEKKDEASSGGGASGFTVIPPKYISIIIGAVLIIGTITQYVAPDWGVNLGMTILKPFATLLTAYGWLIIIAVFTGERKSYGQIFISIAPILLLGFIIPAAFGFSGYDVYGALLFVTFAPIIGNLLRGFLRGGLQAAGTYAATRDKGKAGKAFGAGLGKEFGKTWEEKDRREAEERGLGEFVKEQCEAVTEELERVRGPASRQSALLGASLTGDIRSFYDDVSSAAAKWAKYDDDKVKEKRRRIKAFVIGFLTRGRSIGELVARVRPPSASDPKGKDLDGLIAAVDNVDARLGRIRNAVSS